MKQKVLAYDVVFEKQQVGGYTVTVPSLPGCISEGNTLKEAKANILDAITLYLEDLKADGETIPTKSQHIFIGQILVPSPLIH